MVLHLLKVFSHFQASTTGLPAQTPPFVGLSAPQKAPFFWREKNGERNSNSAGTPLNWQQVRFANLWGFRPTDTRYLLVPLNKRRQPMFVQRSIIIGRSHAVHGNMAIL